MQLGELLHWNGDIFIRGSKCFDVVVQVNVIEQTFRGGVLASQQGHVLVVDTGSLGQTAVELARWLVSMDKVCI